MIETAGLVGVVPSIVIAGPMTVLAALFPATAAAVLLLFRRWKAAIMVLSACSSLLLAHSYFGASARNHWWGKNLTLWLVIGGGAWLGMAWSWRRERNLSENAGLPRFGRDEWYMIGVLSLVALAAMAREIWRGGTLLGVQQRPALVMSIGTCAAVICKAFWSRTGTTEKELLVPERAMLGAIGLASITLTAYTYFDEFLLNDQRVRIAWAFVPEEPGAVYSSPAVIGDYVIAAAVHQNSGKSSGAVYCLNRHNGKLIWTFTGGGSMKPVFSSPCIWNGRVYIGEGFHSDGDCKLYCLDVATGAKIWDFQTKGHTESSPRVADGRVYFGAGDDGLYCVDALSGSEYWHFAGSHVDGKPAVANGCVFAGSGYGKFEVFCLDSVTGKSVWCRPVKLPSFGSPTVDGDRVYFGVGNGNFMFSDHEPAGALLCLSARDGKEVWRCDVGDAVHAKPVVAGERIYFGSRDRNSYCLESRTGRRIWQRTLGSAIVTSPSLDTSSPEAVPLVLHVLPSEGALARLALDTGEPVWQRDVRRDFGADLLFISTPAIVFEQEEHCSRANLYIGSAGSYHAHSAILFCVEEQIRTD